MSEERLQEIKDSVKFQYTLAKTKGIDNALLFTNEEEELIEEIERLNNIIKEFEDILKRDIKACNNKFENMFDRNYRRLILEEKLEQLQELKGDGSDGN